MSVSTSRRTKRQTETFSIRLTSEVKEVLQDLADQDRRSPGQYVSLILERHIEQKQKN